MSISTLKPLTVPELQQYNRNVKERKKIKELQASIGPSGISSRTFDDNDDDVDEAEDRDKGMRLESDETNLSLKPSITVDPPTKPKFKARQPVKHKAINWDEILGTTANQEQSAHKFIQTLPFHIRSYRSLVRSRVSLKKNPHGDLSELIRFFPLSERLPRQGQKKIFSGPQLSGAPSDKMISQMISKLIS